MKIKLILAQGNQDTQYSSTRHNVGFMVLNNFKDSQKLPDFQTKPRFYSEISEFVQGDTKTILSKPTTYYNQTGQAARALVDFYKISPLDVLVIHDELSLDFGTIRVRPSGSDAGNKGIRSLNQHLGPDYWRLRIGIHNQLASKIDAPDFVLSKFSQSEQQALQESILPQIAQIIENFLQDRLEPVSYKANQ